MPVPFDLTIVHPDQRACEAFRCEYRSLPRVQVLCTRYEDLPPHDCFVTAGNSFGIMNAGIDAAVAARLGQRVVDSIQHEILDRHLGEQLVGTAFVVETRDPDRPYLCHAPTMRVPGSIEGTSNVYAATWASLLAIFRATQLGVSSESREGESTADITSVVFPAMGCGYGRVRYSESARQMSRAYAHFLEPPLRLDWDHAARIERDVTYRDGKIVVR